MKIKRVHVTSTRQELLLDSPLECKLVLTAFPPVPGFVHVCTNTPYMYKDVRNTTLA